MSTVQKNTTQPATPAATKPWIARHKILTAFSALVVVILIGFYIFGWPLVKWRFHALFVTSLDEIRHSPTAVARLGEPINVPLLPLPSGDVNYEGDRGDAQFYFEVVGSKEKAQAVSKLRMIDGKWGFTQLELEFPDKQQLDLAMAIQQRSDDTPKFDPNAKQPEVKAPNLPVDISLPELPETSSK